MDAPKSQYPQDLRRILRHADRFARLLFGIERDERASPWLVGRSGELRAVVSSTVADWRSGLCDEANAIDAIRSYLDSLHRGAAKQLHSTSVALECCEPENAITRTGDADSRDLATTLNAWLNELPTLRAPWTDGPEVLARIRAELPRVEAHAMNLSRRLGTRYVTKDDLQGFGREGLLDAARSFDERRGIPFARWAGLRIRNAMMDGARRWSGLPRRVLRELSALESESSFCLPRDDGAGVPLRTRNEDPERGGSGGGEMPEAPERAGLHPEPDRLSDLSVSPEERLAQAEVRALIQDALGHLPDKEREAVEAYYFFGCGLKQIAINAGMTESGVSRMLTRSVEKLDAELKRCGIESQAKRSPRA